MATIEHVYIDRAVTGQPQVTDIVKRLNIRSSVIDHPEELYDKIRSSQDPIAAGKKVLYLTANRGGFIRKCPGTRNYTCCDYMILHIGTFCTMDCAYCILQSYFHPPVLQYFVNQQKMFAEIDEFLAARHYRRIGTGEYTDSMIWELWTDLSQKLIPRFGAQSHAVLELKTKTTFVHHIQGLSHNRRTILAWSVNTPLIIRYNERGTASLDARIDAAAQCQKWGYPLAFHFDPMVDYDGCLDDYRRVVDKIFSRIHPENIVWISLGTLRFMPDLKAVIQSRFPESKMIYGELVPGMDGKSRYLQQIRIDIYRAVLSAIRDYDADVTVYFCMESEHVWQKVFGFKTEDCGGLPHMLDQSAIRICRLDPDPLPNPKCQ